MRKLKKGFAVATVMAMALSMLTACGDSKEVTGNLNATDTDAEESATADTSDMTIDEYIEAYAEGVELGDYIGIEYEYDPAEVTDDDVQTEIDSFVESCETYEEDLESVAEDGDTVNIDFVGTIDGVEFDGGSTEGEGYDLVLGSASLIDDFEAQIVGHTPGETFDVEVTFPDDYGSDDLNGKDAVFETTLNYIKIPIEAEYNDELVAANTDYSTTDEYEEYIRTSLEESNEATALSSAQNTVMTNVINKATISNIPEDEVNELADTIVSQLESQATSYGVEYSTFIYYYYGYSDEDEFYDYVVLVCEESVKEKMVVCAIAKAEGITIDSDEEDAYIAELAESNGVTSDDIEEAYSSEDLMYYTLADKVMDFLMENGTQIESTEEDTEEASEETEEADESGEDTEEEAE